ncbi:hypothetical protein RKLH11_778 [Rhodobacteraceae bacterium KLH11]|nr:hypothetical protein RKLH11_778 [Rhodobacteraceae bacterium KLH11]
MEQFNDPHFSVIALTAALNDQPFVPGQLGDLDIFEEEGVSTTTVKIDENEGNLDLIEPTTRGGPGQTVGDDDRRGIPFEIDHYEINDAVYADEVQGVRQLGSDDQLETIQSRVDTKLARHARSFDATLEHQRIGAIKGVIVAVSRERFYTTFIRASNWLRPRLLHWGSIVRSRASLRKSKVMLSTR